MSYSVYRHEGGKKIQVAGPFDTEDEAREVRDEKSSKINIPCGGFKVHEE